MIKISLWVHFNLLKEHVTLEEMLRRIKENVYATKIKSLRAMLMAGKKEAYDKAKRELDSATFQADFDGRRLPEYIAGYNKMIIADIDHLSDEEMVRVNAIIQGCEYTHASFVSPSGNGLKVLVRVNTGLEEHRNAFLSVQKFYQELTGVEIDPSGKDVTRLCFVSSDEELYYNPDSTVFIPLINVGQTWPVVKPKGPVVKGSKALELTSKDVPAWVTQDAGQEIGTTVEMDSYQRCVKFVERFCTYTVGHRNTYLFGLAFQMQKNGFPERLTLMMLSADYDLDDWEISRCVKNAYGYRAPGVDQSRITSVPAVDQSRNEVFADAVLIEPPQSKAPPPSSKNKRTSKTTSQPATDDRDEISDSSQAPVSPSPKASPALDEDKKKGKKKLYCLLTVEDMISSIYEFRYNVIIQATEYRLKGSRKRFQRLSDYVENSIFRMLHTAGEEIPLSVLHAILTSDFSPDYNPFLRYFRKLPKWDGVTDYIGQLIATVKTMDDAYWAFCFRKWFVAYAASLVVEEVINHTVIVFVGAQGVGKTRWGRLLVPKELQNYFGTAALQSDSKDISIMISECALVILDEMDSMNRKDLASFKEIITRSEIRLRRPYGRNTDNLIRRCSFYSSVNNEQILTDPTGSRRYLCSKVTFIDYQHTVDLDGAMAQARALYQSGFKYWFDQEEIKELTDRNEDFMSKSVEEELLETWIRPVTLAEWEASRKLAYSQNVQRLTATQIAIVLMEKAKILLNDHTVSKLGKIMTKQAYLRIRVKNSYYYLVRILETEVIDRDKHSLGETEDQKTERESNEQIIRFEEDLFNTSKGDGLPF